MSGSKDNRHDGSRVEKIRHSLSHVLAMAVLEKDTDAKLGIGPVIENGFYYDFEFSERYSPTAETLAELQKSIRRIVQQNLTFTRKEVSTDEARNLFKDQPYKLELINELADKGEQISLYTSGSFTDLCAGPHVETTKEINPECFTLIRLAGAYWRGSESNKMLTRIYGFAFETKKELDAFLWQQEEAKKRDHRKLGKELRLFTLSELVGPGLPLMQPRGMIIRKEIEDYLWNLHKDKGYDRVWTPHLAKQDLYKTSGHAAKFGDELFRVKGGDEEFFMKPMNCPHHMQIFADNQFSYRDMPVRYFEPATVYRYEKAGQLAGLTRVRAITQDDGHLFCRASQIGQEAGTIVNIIKSFYTTMGMMEGYWVRLSVRGDDKSKYLGTDEVWARAEKALEDAAKEYGLNYKIGRDEAAFYGPKLDFMFKDAIGREWQLATIQCDFNLPERFELKFINEQGEEERPVVIHRAISGSLERFMGVMIEHFGGAFPTWLAPEQVRVIAINEDCMEFASDVLKSLKSAGIRASLPETGETLGSRIREAEMERIPYIVVIGNKEKEKGVLNIRVRLQKATKEIATTDFIAHLQKEIAARQIKPEL